METNLVFTILFCSFFLGVGFGFNMLAFINDVAVIRRFLTKKGYSDAIDDANFIRFSEILLENQKKNEKQDP